MNMSLDQAHAQPHPTIYQRTKLCISILWSMCALILRELCCIWSRGVALTRLAVLLLKRRRGVTASTIPSSERRSLSRYAILALVLASAAALLYELRLVERHEAASNNPSPGLVVPSVHAALLLQRDVGDITGRNSIIFDSHVASTAVSPVLTEWPFARPAFEYIPAIRPAGTLFVYLAEMATPEESQAAFMLHSGLVEMGYLTAMAGWTPDGHAGLPASTYAPLVGQWDAARDAMRPGDVVFAPLSHFQKVENDTHNRGAADLDWLPPGVSAVALLVLPWDSAASARLQDSSVLPLLALPMSWGLADAAQSLAWAPLHRPLMLDVYAAAGFEQDCFGGSMGSRAAVPGGMLELALRSPVEVAASASPGPAETRRSRRRSASASRTATVSRSMSPSSSPNAAALQAAAAEAACLRSSRSLHDSRVTFKDRFSVLVHGDVPAGLADLLAGRGLAVESSQPDGGGGIRRASLSRSCVLVDTQSRVPASLAAVVSLFGVVSVVDPRGEQVPRLTQGNQSSTSSGGASSARDWEVPAIAPRDYGLDSMDAWVDATSTPELDAAVAVAMEGYGPHTASALPLRAEALQWRRDFPGLLHLYASSASLLFRIRVLPGEEAAVFRLLVSIFTHFPLASIDVAAEDVAALVATLRGRWHLLGAAANSVHVRVAASPSSTTSPSQSVTPSPSRSRSSSRSHSQTRTSTRDPSVSRSTTRSPFVTRSPRIPATFPDSLRDQPLDNATNSEPAAPQGLEAPAIVEYSATEVDAALEAAARSAEAAAASAATAAREDVNCPAAGSFTPGRTLRRRLLSAPASAPGIAGRPKMSPLAKVALSRSWLTGPPSEPSPTAASPLTLPLSSRAPLAVSWFDSPSPRSRVTPSSRPLAAAQRAVAAAKWPASTLRPQQRISTLRRGRVAPTFVPAVGQEGIGLARALELDRLCASARLVVELPPATILLSHTLVNAAAEAVARLPGGPLARLPLVNHPRALSPRQMDQAGAALLARPVFWFHDAPDPESENSSIALMVTYSASHKRCREQLRRLDVIESQHDATLLRARRGTLPVLRSSIGASHVWGKSARDMDGPATAADVARRLRLCAAADVVQDTYNRSTAEEAGSSPNLLMKAIDTWELHVSHPEPHWALLRAWYASLSIADTPAP